MTLFIGVHLVLVTTRMPSVKTPVYMPAKPDEAGFKMLVAAYFSVE